MTINLIEENNLVTYDVKYNREQMSIFLHNVAERYGRIDSGKEGNNKVKIVLPEIYYALSNMLNRDMLNSEVLLDYLEGKPQNRLDVKHIIDFARKLLSKTHDGAVMYDENIKKQSECLKEFYSLLEFDKVRSLPLESFKPMVISTPFIPEVIQESDSTYMLMQFEIFIVEARNNTKLINRLKEPEKVLTKIPHKS